MDTSKLVKGAALAGVLASATLSIPAQAAVATGVAPTSVAAFAMDSSGNLLLAGVMADQALAHADGATAKDTLLASALSNGCCHNNCHCPPTQGGGFA